VNNGNPVKVVEEVGEVEEVREDEVVASDESDRGREFL